MWQEAVELAKRHGPHRTARILAIDYGGLKKRLGIAPAPPPRFLELPAPIASTAGCIVELESPHGILRVEMKGAPDWTELLRAWRQS